MITQVLAFDAYGGWEDSWFYQADEADDNEWVSDPEPLREYPSDLVKVKIVLTPDGSPIPAWASLIPYNHFAW